jgi:hypothetical protein
MNILYNTTYSDPLKNNCMLEVIYDGYTVVGNSDGYINGVPNPDGYIDGYQIDGYHLTVNDGYVVFSSTTYYIPTTEIVIPLPFPIKVMGYICLDVHDNNSPCILIDEVNPPNTGYQFNDGNYKPIDVFFRVYKFDLNNQIIRFLRIVQRGA